MDFLITFVVGVIVGWLIKWVIDSMKAPKATPTTVRMPQKTGELESAQRRIQELEHKLGEAQEMPARMVFQHKDRLEKIHGIGPVFANRLNEAGVHTFSDLAKMSPDRVRDIISPQDWQAIDPPSWIGQASDLALAADVSESTAG